MVRKVPGSIPHPLPHTFSSYILIFLFIQIHLLTHLQGVKVNEMVYLHTNDDIKNVSHNLTPVGC